jgi:hypothetical protein
VVGTQLCDCFIAWAVVAEQEQEQPTRRVLYSYAAVQQCIAVLPLPTLHYQLVHLREWPLACSL